MPRSPKGRAAARGLDARLRLNTLSCLLEMLHSKQLSSSKCWLTVITVSTAIIWSGDGFGLRDCG